jgi:hypothetical protein
MTASGRAGCDSWRRRREREVDADPDSEAGCAGAAGGSVGGGVWERAPGERLCSLEGSRGAHSACYLAGQPTAM